MKLIVSRRAFMKVGIGAALVLAVARSIDREVLAQSGAARPPQYLKISLDEAAAVAAIAAVVLAGNLPADTASRQIAINEIVAAFDRTVAGLPPAVQTEVDELLSLLTFGLTRRFIVGIAKPWAQAGEREVKAFLDGWRNSRFVLFQQGYQALVRALLACWYGNPRSWPMIGYGGPPFAQQLGAL